MGKLLDNQRIYNLTYSLSQISHILHEAGINSTNGKSKGKLELLGGNPCLENSVVGEVDYNLELSGVIYEYGNIDMINSDKLSECMEISSMLLTYMNGELHIYEKIVSLVNKIKECFSKNNIGFNKYLEYISACGNKAMEKCYQRDTENFETFYEYLEQISLNDGINDYIQKVKIKNKYL